MHGKGEKDKQQEKWKRPKMKTTKKTEREGGMGATNRDVTHTLIAGCIE